MTYALDYDTLSDGTVEYRVEGELVATATPFASHIPRPGFWVNMKLEGMPWDAMPCKSLEAAGYLVLASYIESRP